MCNLTLKKFRTMSGAPRRVAVRAHLAQSLGLVWDKSPYELTHSERTALDDMARAIGWRKSNASMLSLSAAFYVYLARDAKPATVQQAASVKTQKRAPFVFGHGARMAA